MSNLERAAWGDLQAALTVHTPACDGDDRYIRDELSDDDEQDMLRICIPCPVFTQCLFYGMQTKAGYWAGENRNTGRSTVAKPPARAEA